MVAAGQNVTDVTDKISQCSFHEGQAGDACRARDAIKPLRITTDEAARDVELIPIEKAYGKAAAGSDGISRCAAPVETDKDLVGVERHRRQGIDRHAKALPV